MIKKMKQYNLSQIMKDAHSLRRNSPEILHFFTGIKSLLEHGKVPQTDRS